MLVTHRRGVRGGSAAANSPSDLVDDGDDNGPRAGEAQPGDTGTECREHLVLRPVPGATGQPGRLSAVLELQHLRGPERAEVYQFSRGQHVRVGCEGGRPAPPCRIDLGKQENPDERRQVASRAARIGLVAAEFADEAGSGGIRPSVEVREHGGDLRLPDAPGDNSLYRGQIGCPRAPARLLDKVFNRRAVAEKKGIRQDRGHLDHISRGVRRIRRLNVLVHRVPFSPARSRPTGRQRKKIIRRPRNSSQFLAVSRECYLCPSCANLLKIVYWNPESTIMCYGDFVGSSI